MSATPANIEGIHNTVGLLAANTPMAAMPTSQSVSAADVGDGSIMGGEDPADHPACSSMLLRKRRAAKPRTTRSLAASDQPAVGKASRKQIPAPSTRGKGNRKGVRSSSMPKMGSLAAAADSGTDTADDADAAMILLSMAGVASVLQPEQSEQQGRASSAAAICSDTRPASSDQPDKAAAKMKTQPPHPQESAPNSAAAAFRLRRDDQHQLLSRIGSVSSLRRQSGALVAAGGAAAAELQQPHGNGDNSGQPPASQARHTQSHHPSSLGKPSAGGVCGVHSSGDSLQRVLSCLKAVRVGSLPGGPPGAADGMGSNTAGILQTDGSAEAAAGAASPSPESTPCGVLSTGLPVELPIGPLVAGPLTVTAPPLLITPIRVGVPAADAMAVTPRIGCPVQPLAAPLRFLLLPGLHSADGSFPAPCSNPSAAATAPASTAAAAWQNHQDAQGGSVAGMEVQGVPVVLPISPVMPQAAGPFSAEAPSAPLAAAAPAEAAGAAVLPADRDLPAAASTGRDGLRQESTGHGAVTPASSASCGSSQLPAAGGRLRGRRTRSPLSALPAVGGATDLSGACATAPGQALARLAVGRDTASTAASAGHDVAKEAIDTTHSDGSPGSRASHMQPKPAGAAGVGRNLKRNRKPSALEQEMEQLQAEAQRLLSTDAQLPQLPEDSMDLELREAEEALAAAECLQRLSSQPTAGGSGRAPSGGLSRRTSQRSLPPTAAAAAGDVAEASTAPPAKRLRAASFPLPMMGSWDAQEGLLGRRHSPELDLLLAKQVLASDSRLPGLPGLARLQHQQLQPLRMQHRLQGASKLSRGSEGNLIRLLHEGAAPAAAGDAAHQVEADGGLPLRPARRNYSNDMQELQLLMAKVQQTVLNASAVMTTSSALAAHPSNLPPLGPLRLHSTPALARASSHPLAGAAVTTGMSRAGSMPTGAATMASLQSIGAGVLGSFRAASAPRTQQQQEEGGALGQAMDLPAKTSVDEDYAAAAAAAVAAAAATAATGTRGRSLQVPQGVHLSSTAASLYQSLQTARLFLKQQQQHDLEAAVGGAPAALQSTTALGPTSNAVARATAAQQAMNIAAAAVGQGDAMASAAAAAAAAAASKATDKHVPELKHGAPLPAVPADSNRRALSAIAVTAAMGRSRLAGHNADSLGLQPRAPDLKYEVQGLVATDLSQKQHMGRQDSGWRRLQALQLQAAELLGPKAPLQTSRASMPGSSGAAASLERAVTSPTAAMLGQQQQQPDGQPAKRRRRRRAADDPASPRVGSPVATSFKPELAQWQLQVESPFKVVQEKEQVGPRASSAALPAELQRQPGTNLKQTLQSAMQLLDDKQLPALASSAAAAAALDEAQTDSRMEGDPPAASRAHSMKIVAASSAGRSNLPGTGAAASAGASGSLSAADRVRTSEGQRAQFQQLSAAAKMPAGSAALSALAAAADRVGKSSGLLGDAAPGPGAQPGAAAAGGLAASRPVPVTSQPQGGAAPPMQQQQQLPQLQRLQQPEQQHQQQPAAPRAALQLDPSRTDLLTQTQGLLQLMEMLQLPVTARVAVTDAWRSLSTDTRRQMWVLLCMAAGTRQLEVGLHLLQELQAAALQDSGAVLAPADHSLVLLGQVPQLTPLPAAKTVHVGFGLLILARRAHDCGAMDVPPEQRLAVVAQLRRLMQPGMEQHPESRNMMVDYMHLTDAAARQSAAEVVLVLRRLLDGCLPFLQGLLPVGSMTALARQLAPSSFAWPQLKHPGRAVGDDLVNGFRDALHCLVLSLGANLAPQAAGAAAAALATVQKVASANRVELALLYVYLYDVVTRRSVVELWGLLQLLAGG